MVPLKTEEKYGTPKPSISLEHPAAGKIEKNDWETLSHVDGHSDNGILQPVEKLRNLSLQLCSRRLLFGTFVLALGVSAFARSCKSQAPGRIQKVEPLREALIL